MKKLAVDQGSIFLVPIATTRFVAGVLIHSDGRGSAVGAFFAPVVSSPTEVNAASLKLEDAILVCRFGDHGLFTKRWRVIGSMPNWALAPWSIRSFARRHHNPDLCYVTDYDDSLKAISERIALSSEGEKIPQDTQYGSGVVEAKLSKLLQ